MRSSWDETWMNVADAIAARSRCVNRQVGVVIVTKENRPMAVGYNGPPANFFVKGEYCDSFCPRGGSMNRGASYSNCVSVHAEVNALLFADRRDYDDGTIYVTSPPCWDCAKVVANSGVSRVVLRVSGVDGHYDNDVSIDFIRSCGIVVDIVEGVSK